MGSAGIGSGNHIAGELFKMMTGVNLAHVPYRGVGPALVDLLGGQVQVMFATMSSSIEYVSGRNLATSSAQPAVSLLTEKNHPSGSTTTSKRSFDTSIPQKESMAIFVSPPSLCGVVPWQLFGHGRSDWSTKLIRGLTSEAPAGFQSRRGLSYDDSAPVSPHNAPFPTVLLAQADRGCHAALSRSIALRVVIIFRMTATMMTLDFLSASARRLWKVLRAGL